MASDHIAAAKPQRYIYWWAALCIALVIALGAVTLAWASSRQSSRTALAVQGSCQFFKDLSGLPIAPTASPALLILIADARVAYTTGACEASKGPLSPPDPRVAEHLPPEKHK